MKKTDWLARILFLAVLSLGVTACSEHAAPKKPEKTIIEKLKSDDPSEQQEGLDEASKKYGGES